LFAVNIAAFGSASCGSKEVHPRAGEAPQPKAGAAPSTQNGPSSASSRPVPASQDYLLQAGDTIDIRFFYNSQLNEVLPIRPDGKVSLVLIGDVQAAGLSANDFGQALRREYGEVVREPEISVIVREFGGQKVYVGGEVLAPGLQFMNSPLTALQAIVQAGGFKSSSDLKQIVVLRNQGTNEPQYISLDLKDTLNGKALDRDVLLQPLDIVFVPMSRSAKFNQFVKTYITELVPITLTLGLNYIFGNSVIVP
jgi:protein involved in polysaccharide export with SLBB domain